MVHHISPRLGFFLKKRRKFSFRNATWPPKKVRLCEVAIIWQDYMYNTPGVSRIPVIFMDFFSPITSGFGGQLAGRTRIFLNPPASSFNRSQFGSLCSHENGFGLACTGIQLCLDICNCIFLPQISADIDANPSKLGDMIQCDNHWPWYEIVLSQETGSFFKWWRNMAVSFTISTPQLLTVKPFMQADGFGVKALSSHHPIWMIIYEWFQPSILGTSRTTEYDNIICATCPFLQIGCLKRIDSFILIQSMT